jgi:hypothetical protein
VLFNAEQVDGDLMQAYLVENYVCIGNQNDLTNYGCRGLARTQLAPSPATPNIITQVVLASDRHNVFPFLHVEVLVLQHDCYKHEIT